MFKRGLIFYLWSFTKHFYAHIINFSNKKKNKKKVSVQVLVHLNKHTYISLIFMFEALGSQ